MRSEQGNELKWLPKMRKARMAEPESGQEEINIGSKINRRASRPLPLIVNKTSNRARVRGFPDDLNETRLLWCAPVKAGTERVFCHSRFPRGKRALMGCLVLPDPA